MLCSRGKLCWSSFLTLIGPSKSDEDDIYAVD